LALGALTPVATQASPEPAPVRRWTEALRAADSLQDALERARARVEVLQAAGDLPSALREALAALRGHPEDPGLLRRAAELALALRLAEPAEVHAARLAAVLPRLRAEGTDKTWWGNTSQELSREALALRAREGEVLRDVRRARWTSLTFLGLTLAAVLFLSRSRPPPVRGGGR